MKLSEDEVQLRNQLAKTFGNRKAFRLRKKRKKGLWLIHVSIPRSRFVISNGDLHSLSRQLGFIFSAKKITVQGICNEVKHILCYLIPHGDIALVESRPSSKVRTKRCTRKANMSYRLYLG